MKPKFFTSTSAFRAWLEQHHETSKELWVGFYKKRTGKPTITWSESVDVALCFGWIDGIRKTIDDASYMNRFTPRRPGSKWSAINVKKVKQLQKLGLMHPAGLKRFHERKDHAGYSYEQRDSILMDSKFEKQFRSHKKAWEFFQKQPPWYKKVSVYWIMSAKQEETRVRRLRKLIETSNLGKRLS
jgi:uncharacterized protein YdeI (YjbR/CyaY-like superfamily)